MGKHQVTVLYQSMKAFWKQGTSVVIWLVSWNSFFMKHSFYTWKKNWQTMTIQTYFKTISSKMNTVSLSLQGKQLRPLMANDNI